MHSIRFASASPPQALPAFAPLTALWVGRGSATNEGAIRASFLRILASGYASTNHSVLFLWVDGIASIGTGAGKPKKLVAGLHMGAQQSMVESCKAHV